MTIHIKIIFRALPVYEAKYEKGLLTKIILADIEFEPLFIS